MVTPYFLSRSMLTIVCFPCHRCSQVCLPDSGLQDLWQPGASPPLHLVGQEVKEQHHMPSVDAHAVTVHSVLHLTDDSCLGSLDVQTEDLTVSAFTCKVPWVQDICRLLQQQLPFLVFPGDFWRSHYSHVYANFSTIKIYFKFLFLGMCVCLCEYMSPVWGYTWKPEEDVRAPGSWVTGGCEIPYTSVLEQNLCVLGKTVNALMHHLSRPTWFWYVFMFNICALFMNRKLFTESMTICLTENSFSTQENK